MLTVEIDTKNAGFDDLKALAEHLEKRKRFVKRFRGTIISKLDAADYDKDNKTHREVMLNGEITYAQISNVEVVLEYRNFEIVIGSELRTNVLFSHPPIEPHMLNPDIFDTLTAEI